MKSFTEFLNENKIDIHGDFLREGFEEARSEIIALFKTIKADRDGAETKEEKTDKVYDSLLKGIKFDLPESVIEEEANYSLERLSEQAKSLNLTLDSYLKAVKKNLEDVKKEYQSKAEEAIKLDLILLEIAKIEKIDASEEEIKEVAKISGLPDTQLGRIKSIVDRRKTIEHLVNLC